MKHFFYPTLLFIGATAMAQQTTTDNRINNEFENLIDQSNNFKEYKVVKETDLKRLQKNTATYIDEMDATILKLEKTISEEQQAQDQLQQDIKAANAQVDSLNSQKDSMQFLGINIDKTVYNIIVWSIVCILAILATLLFLQFKKSKVVTNKAKKDLDSTEYELEELRRKSIEKEQKLGRQLQDERNKLSRIKAAN